jgi:hypothetical protein
MYPPRRERWRRSRISARRCEIGGHHPEKVELDRLVAGKVAAVDVKPPSPSRARGTSMTMPSAGTSARRRNRRQRDQGEGKARIGVRFRHSGTAAGWRRAGHM